MTTYCIAAAAAAAAAGRAGAGSGAAGGRCVTKHLVPVRVWKRKRKRRNMPVCFEQLNHCSIVPQGTRERDEEEEEEIWKCLANISWNNAKHFLE